MPRKNSFRIQLRYVLEEVVEVAFVLKVQLFQHISRSREKCRNNRTKVKMLRAAGITLLIVSECYNLVGYPGM